MHNWLNHGQLLYVICNVIFRTKVWVVRRVLVDHDSTDRFPIKGGSICLYRDYQHSKKYKCGGGLSVVCLCLKSVSLLDYSFHTPPSKHCHCLRSATLTSRQQSCATG